MTEAQQTRLIGAGTLGLVVIAAVVLYFHNQGALVMGSGGALVPESLGVPVAAPSDATSDIQPAIVNGGLVKPQVFGDMGPLHYEAYGLNPSNNTGSGLCGCGFG